MARVTKSPEERREEIITTAQKLFITKGYAETSVGDIVKTIGVAQGTFYYYFKSKEEVVNAIIDGYVNEIIARTTTIMENPAMTPLKKLEMMADAQRKINMKENRNIHLIKGVDIHERIIARLVRRHVPLMSRVLCELRPEKAASRREILFMTEIFVAAANLIFDPGIFQWSKSEKSERLAFIVSFMERSFGTHPGSFAFYRRLMGGA